MTIAQFLNCNLAEFINELNEAVNSKVSGSKFIRFNDIKEWNRGELIIKEAGIHTQVELAIEPVLKKYGNHLTASVWALSAASAIKEADSVDYELTRYFIAYNLINSVARKGAARLSSPVKFERVEFKVPDSNDAAVLMNIPNDGTILWYLQSLKMKTLLRIATDAQNRMIELQKQYEDAELASTNALKELHKYKQQLLSMEAATNIPVANHNINFGEEGKP